MKSYLLSAVVALAAAAAVVIPPPAPPGTVTIAWDYPPALLDTNTTFRLHSSLDVSQPLSSWPVSVTVTGQTWANVPTNASQAFYFVTVSNSFGVSDPSEVRALPPLPVANLRLNR